MFSGIVETTSYIIKTEKLNQAQRIWVECPNFFDDLKLGDSICTNGACLTVEALVSEVNEQTGQMQKLIQFCLGLETLTLLEKSLPLWLQHPVNLERSMRFGDRVHGHLVTGHVDRSARVAKAEASGEVWLLDVEVPEDLKKYFWKKGSACINGVSLTINEINNNCLSFCLIPETLKLTNLKYYKVGDFLNLESDYLAKAYIHSRQNEVQ